MRYYVLLGLFLLTACTNKEVNSFTFKGMGGVLTVTYTGGKNINLEDEVTTYIAQFEKGVSYYKPDSFTTIINKTAHVKPVPVPAWYCNLLQESVRHTRDMGGKFDITFKSEGFLWDVYRNQVPNPDEVKKYLPLVGIENLVVDCTANVISFKKEGVKIDLGGIASGYAADKTKPIMEKYGYKNFLINYTGEIVACGSKYGKPWTVGIRNPFKKEELLKTFEVPVTGCFSVSTSGDYERYIEKDGKKYSHIIDPKSGNPVEGAHSVTIIAPDCTTADAYATGVSVGHKDETWIQEIAKNKNLKIYMITGSSLNLKEY